MGKKKKMLYEDLPVYEIVVDDDDNTGMRFLSIVENPAIEITGYAFSEDIEEKVMSFSVNEDEQIIAGPAMVPNKKIYRNDGGMEYYVTFSPETIKKIVQKFMASNNNRSINVEHSNTMVQAYIQEHWLVKDPVYDGSKVYGFDLPAGSWFVVMKIEDKAFWTQQVRELNKMGFSIEGILGQKLMYMASEESTLEEVLDTLTEEEIEYIFAGEYKYTLPPDNYKSKWYTHPNCKCSFDKGKWTYVYTEEYPCDKCLEMGSKYEKWYTPPKQDSGKPGSKGFSMKFDKISFDYHKTMNTPEGMHLAKKLVQEGNDVHIITDANEKESGAIIKKKAQEVGIPENKIHYAKGKKFDVIRNLGIQTHYDDNETLIDKLNKSGIQGKLF